MQKLKLEHSTRCKLIFTADALQKILLALKQVFLLYIRWCVCFGFSLVSGLQTMCIKPRMIALNFLSIFCFCCFCTWSCNPSLTTPSDATVFVDRRVPTDLSSRIYSYCVLSALRGSNPMAGAVWIHDESLISEPLNGLDRHGTGRSPD